MTDLCKSLRVILEQEARILLETVVVNPQDINKFVDQFAKLVRSQEAKDWFRKKIRNAVLNEPSLMHTITQQNSEYPAYANDALSNGEPVYLFDPSNNALTDLKSQCVHIADWFNAMAQVISRTPSNEIEKHDQVLTKREFSKIMKYNLGVALDKADQWFNLMGTRIVGEKTGVEILKTWPNGYYAVRYTNGNTMKIDGGDLQNCLQHGTYWDAVVRKTMAVFGIRKSNDEAIVGIRATNDRNGFVISECKGKNNNPVISAYRPYVIDFLNVLGMPPAPSGRADLESADIFYKNGRYGALVDMLVPIYDQNGLTVYELDDERMIASYEGNEAKFFHDSDRLLHLHIVDADTMPRNALIVALNILRKKPMGAILERLSKKGIVYNSTSHFYGTIESVADLVAEKDDDKLYSLGDRFVLTNGESFLEILRRNSRSSASTGALSGTIGVWHDDDAFIWALNQTKCKPTLDFEVYLTFPSIAFDGKQYGRVDQLGERLFQSMYQITDRKWIIDRSCLCALTNDGRLIVRSPRKWSGVVAPMVRKLIKMNGISKLADNPVYNDVALEVLPVSDKIIVDLEDFFANLDKIDPYLETVSRMKVGLGDRLRTFLINNRSTAKPNNYDKLLAKYLVPKEPVVFRKSGSRKIFDMTVSIYEIIFSVVAISVCEILRLDVPEACIKAIKLGIEQATKQINEMPNAIYHMSESMNYLRTFASIHQNMLDVYKELSDLRSLMYQHNNDTQSDIKDKLKKGPSDDISSRFAALNMARQMEKKRE